MPGPGRLRAPAAWARRGGPRRPSGRAARACRRGPSWRSSRSGSRWRSLMLHCPGFSRPGATRLPVRIALAHELPQAKTRGRWRPPTRSRPRRSTRAGSRVNERGHLEIGGLRRGRAGRRVRHARLHLRRGRHPRRAPASTCARSASAPTTSRSSSRARRCPAPPPTRCSREEGLSVDVASGGELHMALAAGFDPARIHLHGNNKTEAELRYAIEAGVGHLILDSFDEIERLDGAARPPPAGADPDHPGHQGLAPTPTSRPGQEDSKFGFGLADGLAERAVERGARRRATWSWSGCTPTSAPRSSSSSPTSKAIEVLADFTRSVDLQPELLNIGGGLGIAYLDEDEPPSIEDYVDVKVRGVEQRLRPRPADPDRARPLAGRQRRRHRLPGRHRQGDPRRPHLRRRRRRHVRQPAADALRRPLRGRDRRPRRRGPRHRRRRSPACTASPATC